jgi:hypothetical protein
VRGHSGQLVRCIVHPLTGCFARCHGGLPRSRLFVCDTDKAIRSRHE